MTRRFRVTDAESHGRIVPAFNLFWTMPPQAKADAQLALRLHRGDVVPVLELREAGAAKLLGDALNRDLAALDSRVLGRIPVEVDVIGILLRHGFEEIDGRP